jgi:hypothetical protein
MVVKKIPSGCPGQAAKVLAGMSLQTDKNLFPVHEDHRYT